MTNELIWNCFFWEIANSYRASVSLCSRSSKALMEMASNSLEEKHLRISAMLIYIEELKSLN